MGEVFKARDQRLNRSVALKFLPEQAGARARGRFEREAQMVAALNHPHICSLFEVGDESGRPYLVLELLEGETLRARLARGPVPPAQLVEWGAQIADALDAAHRRGILHRDLKPENIFVLPSGHIKVLDFGLARMETEVGPEDLTMTSPGVMLGTVPYMSPEQARGELVDARSDIFSFGSVFYEMAAGRAPFTAKSAAETLAAVLHQQPLPPSRARTELPPKVDEIAGRCLEKDPELRYQSAADLRSDLRRLSRGSASAADSEIAPGASAAATRAPASRAAVTATSMGPAGSATAPSAWRRRWAWAGLGAAVLGVAALAALGWWRLARREPGAAATPPRLQFRQLTFNGLVEDAAISPDGKFLAHIDDGPQGTSLHLYSIASGSDVEIVPPAPGCCHSPSFSPNGGEVYFVQGGNLLTVPLLGGTAQIIATHVCSGAAFSPDGGEIAWVGGAGQPNTALMLAHADGTGAHVLHRPGTGGYLSSCWSANLDGPMHGPGWSPDGRWIALSLGAASGLPHVVLINAQTGRSQPLGPGFLPIAADLNWLPDGSGLITTAAIPLAALPQVWELTFPGGKLIQLTNDLQGYTASSTAADGQLALVHAVPQYNLWVQQQPQGAFVQIPGGGSDDDGENGVTWTHNGGLATIRFLGETAQIWTENSDGTRARPAVSGNLPNEPNALLAAPNGQLVFGDGEADARIWRVNADGTGLSKLTELPAGYSAYDPSLLLGGREVGYLLEPPKGEPTLWAVPLAGGRPRQIWDGSIYAGTNPASADGTRVFAVHFATGGKAEAVIIRVDGKQPQITPAPGFQIGSMATQWDWTPNGLAITYVRHQGDVDNIWALPLAGGKPRELTHFHDLQIPHYAFAPDGRLAICRGWQNSDAVLATGLRGSKQN